MLRTTWRALALDRDPTPETTEDRLARIAETASIWPFAVFAQLVAPLAVAAAGWLAVPDPGIDAVALCGVPVILFSVAVLVLAHSPSVRLWPSHVQTRLLSACAVPIGVGLIALLPIVARLPMGDGHVIAFVAVFGAMAVTAIALYALRAATLAYAAALVVMVWVDSGPSATAAIATLVLAILTVAMLRLARNDLVRHERLVTENSAGRLATLLVREVEEHGDGWFWQTDRQGKLTYLSEKVARELGRGGATPLGAKLNEVFRIDAGNGDTERTLNFHLSSRTSFSDYSVCGMADADANRWWSISGRPLLDEVGRFQGFVGSGRDLTHRRRSEAEITRLALFDSLTGLANRDRMRASLDKMLAQVGGLRATGLFLLDLDRFKAVNDTMGHQTGDALLKQVGQRLQRAVGEAGLVGRVGGDEFKVLLPGQGDTAALGTLANTIIDALSQPYSIEGSSIQIGCSIGIAIAPDDGADSETLLRNADLALYAAKGEGRGVHRFFREEMLSGAKTRKQLEDDLRHALASDQFHVVYQPVVSTRDARIVGYEALLRWDHPTRGPVSPADFIPVAEECGLIEAIGEWVMRTATREAASWPADVRVAVNVSPIQFANRALPAIITSALANAGLAPDRLELEITEGVFLNDSAQSDRMFTSLKMLGVRLALDDFGTGYSSLGYLRTAPFDKVKIDQSFVRGAAVAGNRNAAIIKAIVTLADTLGMETTAEGVEHQDEVDLIRALGCSHIQGYVYGRPRSSDDVVRDLGIDEGRVVARGFKVSRAQRTTTFRSAVLDLGGTQGEIRIRNISSNGVLIDGIAFPHDPTGTEVMIELLEGQMFPAVIRWAQDGRAGLELLHHFDLAHLNQPSPKVRKAG